MYAFHYPVIWKKAENYDTRNPLYYNFYNIYRKNIQIS